KPGGIVDADAAEGEMSEGTFDPSSLPTTWTPIAWRPRNAFGGSAAWQDAAKAPISIEAAKELARLGAILMANRHLRDRIELVIRRVLQTERKQTERAAPPTSALIHPAPRRNAAQRARFLDRHLVTMLRCSRPAGVKGIFRPPVWRPRYAGSALC